MSDIGVGKINIFSWFTQGPRNNIRSTPGVARKLGELIESLLMQSLWAAAAVAAVAVAVAAVAVAVAAAGLEENGARRNYPIDLKVRQIFFGHFASH
jgi:uncharacterized membrane protein YfbV (UPF0208 family)